MLGRIERHRRDQQLSSRLPLHGLDHFQMSGSVPVRLGQRCKAYRLQVNSSKLTKGRLFLTSELSHNVFGFSKVNLLCSWGLVSINRIRGIRCN